MIVTLDWPTGPCWPNRKAHWSVLNHHRRAQHRAAWATCVAAGVPKGAARLRVAFHPPRRPGLMNVDGAIAAVKAGVDGIAQALGVDDSALRIEWPETFAEPVKGGSVVVKIEIPA